MSDDIMEAVTAAYVNADKPLSNTELYQRVAKKIGLSLEESQEYKPVGRSRNKHNLYHRKVRWVQQSLKQQEILVNITKGIWAISGTKKIQLRAIQEGKRVIAMSTELGLCLWAKSDAIFNDIIDEPIHLVLTSPPYPLKVTRAYGNVQVHEYIDFVCRLFEPIIDKLAVGASIALNVSNDIFESGSPARSTYLERLIIAFEDRLGLKKMDTLQWVSNKAPGPIAWASKERFQLNTGYEPILWFCNDPLACFADNRRVLKPHKAAHDKFIKQGGLKTAHQNADGNYRKKAGAFSTQTIGSIPKNVLEYSNYCHSGRRVNAYAKHLGLPVHGAKMPGSVADFLIQFLSGFLYLKKLYSPG